MRVVCESCGQESEEADMGSDCVGTDDGENWSNHICPFCGFWNDTHRVWAAKGQKCDAIDLREEV